MLLFTGGKYKEEEEDDDTYNTKSMYRIDWINGMIWLGYFMAGIMWHLNKQIYHCKKNMEKKCSCYIILYSVRNFEI